MASTTRKRRILHFAAVAAASLGLTLAALPASATESAPAADPATTAAPHAPGRYIVTLADKPVAAYDGGVPGIAPTRPAAGARVDLGSANARKYRSHLNGEQTKVAKSVGARPEHGYSVSTDGFVADLSAAQAAKLSTRPDVLSVTPDTVLKAADDRNSTDYLGLSGDHGLWSALGGTANAGKGVVIGDIDTGIWPESPSFAAPALPHTPPPRSDHFQPYVQGTTTVMPKADGGTFVGTCQTGEQFDASDCNQKIISARYFGDAWLAQVPQDKRADYVSPRDGQGHGTHTASTAAGNPGVDATVAGQDFGKISGVAPAAKIAVYKALWSGKDGGLSGGYASDILEAVDQAVADGVDVINFSVGFTALEESADDPIDLAFLNAADAGIFVAAAGGNAGPGAGTLSNIAPWETTAAATTIAPHTASVVLGDGTTHTGYSTTVTAAVGPKPLVLASAVKAQSADTGSASLCMPGTLDPALTAGKIVVCDRGSNDRVTKSAEVARAGGSGMVLVNLTDLDTDGDLHSVPTVHLNTPDSLAVRTYAGTDGARASLVPGGTGDPYPQVAGFSSRGPSATNHGDLLKPDIAAPGVSILAAVAPPTNAGENFAFESGTSMATPHIAGLAALYLGKHPKWSPMKVKSAMMTTATPTVNAAGKKSTDPFAQGSGEVDPADMLDPGLVYDSGRDDWMSYLEALGDDTGTGAQAVDVSDLNYPSIAVGELLGSQTVTREVTAVKTGTYRATVDVPGFKATVKPSVLTFDKAGRTKQFTVTFVQEKAQSGVTATGSLTWKGAGTSVRSPIALTPQGALAPDEVRGTGQSGKVSFSVTPGFDRFPVTAYGLTSGPSVQGTFNGQDPERDYVTQVAKGAKAVEFNVRSDPKSSVLIVVFKGDITTDPTSQVIAFPTPLPGDSSYAIPHPQPGPYTIAIVDAGDAPGTTSTAFTYQASQVTSRGGTGKLTVSPRNPDATQGVPLDLTASWSGLPAEGRYTGYIEYPGGAGTVITVN